MVAMRDGAMRSASPRIHAFGAVLVAVLACGACSDIGDSSALPSSGNNDGSPELGADASAQNTASGTDSSSSIENPPQEISSGTAEGEPASSGSASGASSTGSPSNPSSTGTSSGNTTPVVDAAAGTGAAESGASSHPDATADAMTTVTMDGAMDSSTGTQAVDSPADTPDTQGGANSDATTVEASIDSAASDGTASDATTTDGSASPDSGHQGGSLGPCTSAGQTDCVQCEGNGDGLCTPSEALFVQFDITQGVATAAGPDPMTSCYACLYNNGCIDDTVNGDTGYECGDLSGTFTNGSGSSVDAVSTCLTTLQCTLTKGCGQTNGGLTNCYCGAGGGTPSACASPSAGPNTNGACKTEDVAGFKDPADDSADIVGKDFTSATQPSGVANQMFACGQVGGHCPQCLQ